MDGMGGEIVDSEGLAGRGTNLDNVVLLFASEPSQTFAANFFAWPLDTSERPVKLPATDDTSQLGELRPCARIEGHGGRQRDDVLFASPLTSRPSIGDTLCHYSYPKKLGEHGMRLHSVRHAAAYLGISISTLPSFALPVRDRSM